MADPATHYTVTVPVTGAWCRVTIDATKRAYVTSKHQLMTALAADEGSAPTSASGQWIDMLATHGFAMKQVDTRVSYLIVVPAGPRVLLYQQREGDPLRLDVTLPPLLLALRFKDNQLQSAYESNSCYIVDPSKLSTLAVDDRTPCLHFYPWGNVFSHGGICWGRTAIADIQSFMPAACVHAFFDSPFNEHLWSEAHHAVDGSLPAMARRTKGVLTWGGTYPNSIADFIGRF